MAGKLYLCATPIGNLEDITFRVLRILKEVDLIGAEDTRHSIKLLNHFEIKTPMTSYHEYNKVDKAKYLVQEMLNGKNIALITDAGTPGISDPGEELVRQCIDAGIEVSSVPGPAACITALTMSGQATRRFAFEAFLPADKKERALVLEELKEETRTMIIYEAPHHLLKTLKELYELLGDRSITLCKELTKLHGEKGRVSLVGCWCETPLPTAGPASGQDGASGHRLGETTLPVRLTFWWKQRTPRAGRSQAPVLSAQGEGQGPRGALGGGAAASPTGLSPLPASPKV